MQTKKFGARWYVEVDRTEAEPGDILDYLDPQVRNLRTHRVSARRGGKKAAVRVTLHAHEGGERWVPMADVVTCWRKRPA